MYSTRMVDVPKGDYISLAQAAEIIGCTKRNAQNYIESGKLAAVNVDGFWIVLKRDAKKFKRPKKGRPRKDGKP